MLQVSTLDRSRCRSIACFLRAGMLGVLVTAGAAAQAQGQQAQTALIQDYRRAHESKEVNAAMRLVDMTRVEASIKQSFAANFGVIVLSV